MLFLFYPLRFLFIGLYKAYLHICQALYASNAFVDISIDGIQQQPISIPFFGPQGQNLFQFREMLKRAARDPNVRGIVIRIHSLEGAGLASIEEIREQIRKFNRSGKFSVAYLQEADTRAYFLASACEKVFMQPSGTLGPLGLHMQQPFLRKTLDKIGIEPELEHIGDYKTASDTFMREDASEAHRDMMNWLLDHLYEEIVTEIQVRRGLSPDHIREAFDEGFLDGEQARDWNLVDELMHENNLEDWIRDRCSDQFTPVDDQRYRGRSLPGQTSWLPPSRIAILHAGGAIHTGEGQVMPNPTVGSSTIIKTLRELRGPGGPEGILLRINSPGGSAVASDAIAREIQHTRESDHMPVVASMGDVAASGGYYISALSRPVYAGRTTLTGSIGVVMGKFNAEELLEKAGVETENFKRGDRADLLSVTKGLEDEERTKLISMMERVYEQFLDVVEEGRNIDREKLEDLAEGRVWTGKQAQNHGLVDRTGGIDDALRKVRSQAGIDPDAPVRLIPFPHRHMNLFGSPAGVMTTILKYIPGRRFLLSLFVGRTVR